MKRYVIKRILQAIPLLLLISFIVFSLIYIAPFDVLDSIIRPDMSPETIEFMRHKYGLDQPFLKQYIVWLTNVLKGDFGFSVLSQQSISGELMRRIPNTLKLILPAYLTALTLSVSLGLFAASHEHSWVDRFLDTSFSIFSSTPTFWVAMMVIYIFGLRMGWFPFIGMGTVGEAPNLKDFLMHLFAPWLTLVLALFPHNARYVRSSAINELNRDYVQVQRSLGASQREIFVKHIAKNTLLPLVTRVAMDLPMLVTGAIVTESIFSWPGVGPYFIAATKSLDYPIIMAIMLLTAILVILGNLIADITYGLIDPRIQKED